MREGDAGRRGLERRLRAAEVNRVLPVTLVQPVHRLIQRFAKPDISAAEEATWRYAPPSGETVSPPPPAGVTIRRQPLPEQPENTDEIERFLRLEKTHLVVPTPVAEKLHGDAKSARQITHRP